MAFSLLYYLFFIIIIFCCDASIYKNYSMDNAQLCPLKFQHPTIYVGKENTSAVLVKDGQYFKSWNGEISLECKFTVKATFSLSLMAVIQSLSLRKDEASNECIDYIQFKIPKEKSPFSIPIFDDRESWKKTKKVCGHFRRNEPIVDDLSEYSLKHKGGVIDVKIFIARKPVPPNSTIGFEVAFTSYRECRFTSGAYHYCEDKTCIHKSYFSDGIVNCVYPHCSDEASCYIQEESAGESELKTQLTITAVTSIFLSFFLFLGCMMLCRYCLLLRQWHHPVVVEMSTPPAPETERQPSPTFDATAPPLDKDLPPAYETLFPDR